MSRLYITVGLVVDERGDVTVDDIYAPGLGDLPTLLHMLAAAQQRVAASLRPPAPPKEEGEQS